MKLFHGIIQKTTPQPDGSLEIDAIAKGQSEFKNEVGVLLNGKKVLDIDSSDSNLDTWEEVAKYIIDTYTNLSSDNIIIEDTDGTKVPSEDIIWEDKLVVDTLLDISEMSNSFLILDENITPVMRTYKTAQVARYMIKRGSNLISNDASKDIYSIINSVNASIETPNNTLFYKSVETSGGSDATQTYGQYIAAKFSLPARARTINYWKVYVDKIGSPGGPFEMKLMFSNNKQSGTPPDYTDSSSTLATVSIPEVSMPPVGWVTLTPTDPIDIKEAAGKYIWLIAKRQGTSISHTYDWAGYIDLTDQFRQNHAYDPDGIASGDVWDDELSNRSFPTEIWGDLPIKYSGSTTDTESIEQHGLKHRNMIAKGRKSDAGCQQYAEAIVEFYKEGLIIATTSTPFNTNVFPGMRIILYDPVNTLFFEDLLVNAISYNPTGSMTLSLTEPILTSPSKTEKTDKELFATDQLSFT